MIERPFRLRLQRPGASPVNTVRTLRNQHDLPVSWDILAACLTGKPTGVVQAGVWQAVVDLAEPLCLGPLLNCTLGGAAGLPPELRVRLQDTYASAGRAAIAHYRVLSQAAQVFAAAGLQCILLKGLALAQAVYPDWGARPMVDLDLLVRTADVDRAAALLEALGYRLRPDHAPDFDRRFGGEWAFERPDQLGPQVELHWDLLHFEWSRRTTASLVDDLWARVRPLTVGQSAVWQLAPDDMTLYLCLHMAVHHAYGEIRQFVDLDRWIRFGPALDWPALVAAGRRYRLRRILYFALHFCRQLFDTPIPDDILRQLQPPVWICRWVEQLAAPIRALPGGAPLGPQAGRFLHFLLVDRWPDRWRGVAHAFFPGRDWIMARYEPIHPGQAWLLSLRHIARMVWLMRQGVSQLRVREVI